MIEQYGLRHSPDNTSCGKGINGRIRVRARIVGALAAAPFAILQTTGAGGSPPPIPTLEWTRDFGTSGVRDANNGVSVDNLGNVYTTGSTEGGTASPSFADPFLRKYDSAGNLLWFRQIATNHNDLSQSVATDHLGNAFITGYTFGSIGGPNLGATDAFLVKYDPSGNQLWARQLGTSNDEEGYGAAADGLGNVYVTGRTQGSLGGANPGGADAFLTKYDGAGNQLWARQLRTNDFDTSRAVSVDGVGNVYIAGWTAGSLSGTSAGDDDAFVSKYNASGDLLWTRQYGTSSEDLGYGVAADSLGNVYLTGTTGNIVFDAFVVKYDSAGNLAWSRQIATNMDEKAFGAAVDLLGSVYVTGYTRGNLGAPNAGSFDTFVRKFDTLGNHEWTWQSPEFILDQGNSVSVDQLGQVYVAGEKTACFSCNYDGFVTKLSVVPEPGAMVSALIAVAALASICRRIRFYSVSHHLTGAVGCKSPSEYRCSISRPASLI